MVGKLDDDGEEETGEEGTVLKSSVSFARLEEKTKTKKAKRGKTHFAFPSIRCLLSLTLHHPATTPIVANPNPAAVIFSLLIPSPISFSL